ncbi:MAG: exodeoxyribonuclease VII large subunit [Verrucomicrobiota bacterium]
MSEFDLFAGGETGREPVVWSVSDLTDEIRDLLESKVGDVKVTGEISNFRRQSASGHLYFSLKDADAQISAVMFRGDASRLKFEPEDGAQVVATGMITVYKPRGNYQIRLRSMKPAGQGELQAQFEALKFKLSQEGLFDQSRKQTLPVFPRRIGLITSPTGAAVRDFLQVIGRRCPHIHLLLGGTRVQGEGAAGEMADMLHFLNQQVDLDLIVLTRGGGSLEDLWAFNEEVLARAIAQSDIPVVSAVGHEIDFTIADFVADARAPTPSAAAELVATSREEWLERLDELQRRMRLAMERQAADWRAQLDRYRSHYVFQEPVRLVETALQRVDELGERLQRQVMRMMEIRHEGLERLKERMARLDSERLIRNKRQLLQKMAGQLRLLSPQGVLDRGYGLIFDSSGRLVRCVKQLEFGDRMSIQLQDGRIYSKVDKKSQTSLIDPAGEKARRQ